MIRFILFLVLGFIHGVALAAPAPFKASYQVMKGNVNLGVMNVSLSYQEGQYTYKKEVASTGLARWISGDEITEISTGLKQGHHLLAQNYVYSHKNRKRTREERFELIRSNQRVQAKGRYKNQPFDLFVPQAAIDFALLDLYLSDDVRANRGLKYHVIRKGKLETYSLQYVGNERVALANGERVEAMHVRYQSKDDKALDFWLAPAKDYSLVKITHHDENGRFTILQSSYSLQE